MRSWMRGLSLPGGWNFRESTGCDKVSGR
jgi:hypothetical protein